MSSRLRPLDVPRPVRVDADGEGRPVALHAGGHRPPRRDPPPGPAASRRDHPPPAGGAPPGAHPAARGGASPVPGRDARQVVAIRETWRIDDEWWRRPISRLYFAAVLENGRPVTLYRDLGSGRWYLQGGGA